MKYRTLLIWLWLGVTAIIVMMIAVTFLWHRERREIAERRLAESLRARLAPLQTGIERVLQDEAVVLTKLLDPIADNRSTIDVEELASLQAAPEIESLLVWSQRTNRVFFPDRIDHLPEDRQALIRQGLQILREEVRAAASDESTKNSDSVSTNAGSPRRSFPSPSFSGRKTDGLAQDNIGNRSSRSVAESSTQWVTWYQDRRMRLALIRRLGPDHWSMLIPPTTRLTGKIIADNNDNFRLIAQDALIQLRDANGNVVHQGGTMALSSKQPLIVEPLDEPLESWNLAWFGDVAFRSKLIGDDPFWPAVVAVTSLSSLLIVGAGVAGHSIGRQFRLAEQRVSFVNQVSHELRTPLTNIGMYTDLLEQELKREIDDEQSPSLQKIRVIRDESRRLNRLIRNVLEFGRSRKRLLHTEPAVLDDIIRPASALFEPRFHEVGLKVELLLKAERPVKLDTDVVEQILINFLSNAEKYASHGKRIWIQSEQTSDRVTFRVVDSGPGIPASEQARIFRPFYRLDDSISAPTGSGIGLAVARELALLHAGDCRVENAGEVPALQSLLAVGERFGACFRCDLAVESVVESPSTEMRT